MVCIKPIPVESTADLKAVRLAALKDSPLAFGSTFERESMFADQQWTDRAIAWNGEKSIAYLAWDGDRPCGIAAGCLDQDHVGKAHLVSMWVAPSHRTCGVGRALVEQVIAWAQSKKALEIRLMVTSCNHGAERFYERLGFARTGKIEPYPNRADLVEYEMSRPV